MLAIRGCGIGYKCYTRNIDCQQKKITVSAKQLFTRASKEMKELADLVGLG